MMTNFLTIKPHIHFYHYEILPELFLLVFKRQLINFNGFTARSPLTSFSNFVKLNVNIWIRGISVTSKVRLMFI